MRRPAVCGWEVPSGNVLEKTEVDLMGRPEVLSSDGSSPLAAAAAAAALALLVALGFWASAAS